MIKNIYSSILITKWFGTNRKLRMSICRTEVVWETPKLLRCRYISILFLFFLFQNTSIAQSDGSLTIEQQIVYMDSLLFNVAFNECNLAVYKTIMTEDIEFYDDRSGLSTSLDEQIASFKDKCSKPFSVTRQLEESSIDQLGDFGAVQTGSHSFYVDGQKVETARFVTVWERKPGGWIVKRAISYDHRSVE